jgi:DNA-directed RNA polymerase specialized sigma24 family protein
MSVTMGVTSEEHEFVDGTARLRPELLARCYRMLASVADAEDAV